MYTVPLLGAPPVLYCSLCHSYITTNRLCIKHTDSQTVPVRSLWRSLLSVKKCELLFRIILLLLYIIQKGLYLTAVFSFFLSFFFLLSTFFRHLISEVKERISTKLGHIFTYDWYLTNLVRTLPPPPGVYPHGLGQKTASWDRLRTLTETISATEHDINNRKETRQSTGTPIHAAKFFFFQEGANSDVEQYRTTFFVQNFGPQTAENGWRLLTTTLKFARKTSCRLTFTTHFGLIIFTRWRLRSTQMPRAWLALAKLRAGRAHAGLCHASRVLCRVLC